MKYYKYVVIIVFLLVIFSMCNSKNAKIDTCVRNSVDAVDSTDFYPMNPPKNTVTN